MRAPFDRLRAAYRHVLCAELIEAPPCIDRDLDHMVDDTHHPNPR